MNDQVDVQALAREFAVRMAPDALLEAEDVGALRSPTHVGGTPVPKPYGGRVHTSI